MKILDVLLCVLIAMVPFSGLSIILDYIYHIIIIITVCSFLYQLLGTEKKIALNFDKKIVILFFMYFLYILCSLTYTIDFNITLKYVLLFGTLLLWIIISRYREDFWLRLQNIILFFGVMLSISIFGSMFNENFVSTFFKFLLPQTPDYYKIFVNDMYHGIYAGFCFERALSAVALNLGIGVILVRYIINRKIKFYEIVLLIIFFLALFATGKRTLTLIPVIAFFVITFANKNKNFIKTAFIISLVSGILIVLVSVFVPSSQKVFDRFINDKYSTTELREELYWRYSFKMFEEKPILGYGVHTYSSYLSLNRNSDIYDGHNIYFQILGENGLIGGTLLYFSMFYTYLSLLFKIRKYNNNLDKNKLLIYNYSLYVQTLFLVYGITGNPLYVPSQLFMYFCAINSILNINGKEEKDEKNRNINIS